MLNKYLLKKMFLGYDFEIIELAVPKRNQKTSAC